MNHSKKVNSLLREHDLFIQEYGPKTPKSDDVTFVECFLKKQLKKLFPQGGRPNSSVLWERAQGGGGRLPRSDITDP